MRADCYDPLMQFCFHFIMSQMMSSKEMGIIGARSRLRWMGKSVCGQGVDGIFVCAVYPPARAFTGCTECGLLPHITVAPEGNDTTRARRVC